jgi:hypothetical protein
LLDEPLIETGQFPVDPLESEQSFEFKLASTSTNSVPVRASTTYGPLLATAVLEIDTSPTLKSV